MAKVTLKDVRLGFPALYEPQGVGDSEDKAYGARFILDPVKHKALGEELDKAMLEVATAKWGAKGQAVLDKLVKDGKVCFSREEYTSKSGDPYNGFEDMWHVGARTPENKPAPTIVNQKAIRVTKQTDEGAPYSGCYVVAKIDIWAQDNGFGRRINASLSGVQFMRDGDAFGGGRPADPSEFEDLSDTGEPEDASDLG